MFSSAHSIIAIIIIGIVMITYMKQSSLAGLSPMSMLCMGTVRWWAAASLYVYVAHNCGTYHTNVYENVKHRMQSCAKLMLPQPRIRGRQKRSQGRWRWRLELCLDEASTHFFFHHYRALCAVPSIIDQTRIHARHSHNYHDNWCCWLWHSLLHSTHTSAKDLQGN